MGNTSIFLMLGLAGASFVLYYCLPLKYRWLVLLGASYLFYWLLSHKLIIFLLISTVSVYLAGLMMDQAADRYTKAKNGLDAAGKKAARRERDHRKKAILILALALNIGLLFFFKYWNTMAGEISGWAGKPGLLPLVSHLKLPLGISYYTLMAISYLTDVYRGKYRAGRSIGKVALFLAFFPQIVEGPFGRYDQLADQLYAGNAYDDLKLRRGILLVLCGLFKLLVIADMISPFVGEIFNNHANYHGLTVVFGAIAYTIQIYADFSGSINIVEGTASLFGVTLARNFEQPFVSTTVGEFWRRWHITLGSWLKDYIFYPVSLSGAMQRYRSFCQKRLSAYWAEVLPTGIALLAVWVAMGVWHGAGSKYILYGLYYFFIMFIELLNTARHLGEGRHGAFIDALRRLRTFAVITLGLMLFRADSTAVFIKMLGSIFNGFADLSPFTSGAIFRYSHAVDPAEFTLVATAFIIVLAVDWANYKGSGLLEMIIRKPYAYRLAAYLAIIAVIVVFGSYGPGYGAVNPIYANF